MTRSTALPSDREREAFANKLVQFRDSLTPTEQRMLDAMAIAAFGPREPEVEGYTWFYRTERGHRPDWYHSPRSWSWTDSRFAWHWPWVP